jgi:CHASE2 domain-containing sensor protein
MMEKISTLRAGFARAVAAVRSAAVRAWNESLRILREARRKVVERWDALSDTQQDFAKNLGIGFGLMLAIAYVSRVNAFAELKRATLDWQIAMLSGTDSGPGVAFVDVDQASEDAYQDAAGHAFYFTPRDKIMELIQASVAARPSAVVVDFDLSQPMDDPFADAFREVFGRPPNAAEAKSRKLVVPKDARLSPVQRFFVDDWRLGDYLATYANSCASKPEAPAPGSCVPIILTRSTVQAPQGPGVPVLRTQLRSFVDDALTGTRANSHAVFWGSTTFDHDDDYVVRHWRLWEPACTPDGKADVLTSSALLAVSLTKGWIAAEPLHAELKGHFAPSNCGGSQAVASTDSAELKVGSVLLSKDELARTERFSIRWTATGSSLANQFSARVLSDASERPDIACHDDGGPCATGKIVVIGSSYRDNGDFHRTPTLGGDMPGTVVLVNEINSLLQPQPTLRESWLLSYLIEGTLVVLLSWFFIFFDPTLVSMIATTLTLLVLTVLSFAFLGAGVWLDVSLPLVGIQVHEWYARAERAMSPRKGAGA